MKQHEIQEVFISNLKAIRRIVGYNQTEFAELIGTSRSNVGAYEEGRAMPCLEMLRNICDIFLLESIEDLCFKELPNTFNLIKQAKWKIGKN